MRVVSHVVKRKQIPKVLIPLEKLFDQDDNAKIYEE